MTLPSACVWPQVTRREHSVVRATRELEAQREQSAVALEALRVKGEERDAVKEERLHRLQVSKR